ncbi:MAG: DEAD/DEAH box helicase [Candidatus Hydrogenedentes bacterium]|nr:DEAD/DEAH box helicase [Candidatus Hydrogenedentota bacterium]
MSFDHFDLDPRCLDLLEAQNIVTPTPVQEQAIPLVMEGRDAVAIAQTGTGKTLAFVLPGLTLLARGKLKHNSMLVLVPTRELCVQVHEVVRDVASTMGIRSTSIYGGVSLERQTRDLRKGCHVLVATPGRLLDHMSRRNVRFDHLQILVLDEADRMLDMGFLPDILRILQKLPEDRQTLMFSATFPDAISRLSKRMLRDPERVSAGEIEKPVAAVRQLLYPVRQEHKSRLLLELLEKEDPGPALIFLRTKIRTETLAHVLKKKGHNVAQLHGDRSQAQRQQALDGFRKGKYDILVATDVAARGLDIEGITHVFNYDIPPNPEDYIHRIGRTARAEAEGDAITFVTPAEFQALGAIEKALGHNIPRDEWDDAPRVLSIYRPIKPKRGTARRRASSRRLLRRR